MEPVRSFVVIIKREPVVKILLINPPNHTEVGLGKETNRDLGFQPIPIGLLIIREALKKRNFDVTMVNLFKEQFCDWEKIKLFFEQNRGYDFVGITCSTRQRFSLYTLIRILEKGLPNADLFLGGPHATFLQEGFFERFPNISCIISGEGDDAVVKYIQMRMNGLEEDIVGVSYRKRNGEIKIDRRMARAEDINNVLPIYDEALLKDFTKVNDLQMHLKNIHDLELESTSKIMAPILCSRGCTGGCFFCSNGSFFGSSQRYYNVDCAFSEIEHYYNDYNIRCFDFYDDNFTSDNIFVHKLCDKIIEHNMKIHWWCSSRVDAVNEALLSKMKHAGCFKISYGVESGSQKVLDTLKKRTNVSQIVEAFRLSKKIGLTCRATISIGHLAESWDTIKETTELLNTIKPDNVGIFILKVYPGTPLFNYAKEKKYLSDDYWFDENQDLVPFFSYETELTTLFSYRDYILNNLKVKNRITDGGDPNAGSRHLELVW